MESTFGRLKPSTLRSAVLREIRDAILKGELPLGAQINQSDLAKRFGTSRAPIREALSVLEKEGLVDNIPYRGTFVTDFDKQPVGDVYDLRLLLETYAVEQAIQRGKPDQFTELRELFKAMGQKAAEEDIDSFYELDVNFHGCIYHMAQNPLLVSMWEVLSSSVRRGIYLTNPILRGISTFGELLEVHIPILEAVEAKDIELAQLRVQEHIELSRQNQIRGKSMFS